jgi:hypothetical protein
MTRAAGHAIACQHPATLFPGAATRQAADHSGWSRPRERPQPGGKTCDPAGVPFRQPVPMPAGIPADTGNPAPPLSAGSSRSGPSGGLPDRYSTVPVKQYGKARGDNQVWLIAVNNMPSRPLMWMSKRLVSCGCAPPEAWPGEAPSAEVRVRARAARARLAWAGTAPRRGPCGGRGRPPAAPQWHRRRTPDRNRAAANCAFASSGMRNSGGIPLRNPEARPGKASNSRREMAGILLVPEAENR